MTYLAAILMTTAAVFASGKADEVKTKAKETASAVVDYSKEQKEAFQKDMEGNLDSIKADIAKLKSQVSQKKGEAQKGLNDQIAKLEKKQDEMAADLKKLKTTSGKAWGEIKLGVSNAWSSLSESYAKAKSEFKDKQ